MPTASLQPPRELPAPPEPGPYLGASLEGQGLLALIRHGVLVQDGGGRILSANPAAERILGLTLAQMNDPAVPAGPRWGLLRADGSLCPADGYPCRIALDSGKPVDDLVLGLPQAATGKVRWLQMAAAPLRQPGEPWPNQALISIADINPGSQQLREIENKHKYLLENLNEIVMMVDNDDRVLFINRRFTELLGYQPEEILGKIGHQVLVDEADHKLVKKANNKRKRRIYSQYEVDFIRKDGVKIPFLVSGSPRFDAEGRVIGSIGTLTDIRERKKSERETQEVREHFETIFRTNPDPILILRLWDNSIININNAFTKVTGYGRSDVVGNRDFEAMIHFNPEDRERFGEEIRNHGYCDNFETRFQTKAGDTFLVSLSARLVKIIGLPHLIVLIRDITQRRATEEALRQSERLLREAQQVAHLGHFVMDLDQRWWQSSPVVDEILGIGPDFPRDLNHGQTLVAKAMRPKARDCFRAALASQARLEFDCQIIRPSDREMRWVSLIAEFEGREPAESRRMIGTLQDITDRKRLEQQLIQAQKLEGVGTLAGGIAHDFNNVLAMILGSADLMDGQLEAQPQLARHLARIKEAAERGASISRQLLVFSRPDQGEVKPVSLAATVAELKDMLEHFLSKNLQIETVIREPQGLILGDPGQLYQALMNLALNGADAMAGAGRLTLTVFPAGPEDLKPWPDLAPDRHYLGVEVADTGTGMDERLIEKIFEPFFSTKEKGKGTGLGLAIVHGIVKSHNGFIDVQSSPGAGTRFRLFFPLVDDLLLERPPEGAARAVSSSGTILITEDEVVLREVLEESLTGAGYTVLTAANGVEALERFREHPGGIDLVITDLGMPEMGGEELVWRLRALEPAIKIMISSGHLEGLTQDHLAQMGICRVLRKPYRLQLILEEIRKII